MAVPTFLDKKYTLIMGFYFCVIKDNGNLKTCSNVGQLNFFMQIFFFGKY